jgi:hypothetical protein
MPVFINCDSQLLICVMNLTQCMSVQIFSLLSIQVVTFWVQHRTLMQMGAILREEILLNSEVISCFEIMESDYNLTWASNKNNSI